MNAQNLLHILIGLQEKGYDLNDLPLFFVEDNKTCLLRENYITVVTNVTKFNNEQDTQIKTISDQALVIGPMIECSE